MLAFRRRTARGAATLAALAALSACATTPVNTAELAHIHSISLEGFAEPDYFLAARAHVGADSYRTISALLAKEGYQIVADGSSADAVLSLNFAYAAYNGAGEFIGQGCQPAMLIDVTLRAKNGETILRRTYFFGDASSTGLSGNVLLRADHKYTLSECTTTNIMANADLGVSAPHSAVPELAQAVAAELTK